MNIEELNINNCYFHLSTKIMYNFLCRDNNVVWIRKMGTINPVSQTPGKHPKIKIQISTFLKYFEKY